MRVFKSTLGVFDLSERTRTRFSCDTLTTGTASLAHTGRAGLILRASPLIMYDSMHGPWGAEGSG